MIDFFEELDDKRRSSGNKQHELLDIITISICGVICGAESWEEIEQYGKITSTNIASNTTEDTLEKNYLIDCLLVLCYIHGTNCGRVTHRHKSKLTRDAKFV